MNKKRSYSVNGEDKHEWFSLNPVKYDNTGTNGIYTDQWEIEVEENNWGFTRDATITIVVTDKEETLSATTVINIIQGMEVNQRLVLNPHHSDSVLMEEN